METIIGKINGVSLECTPSLPIVENIDHIYQFIWDDSNLDGTIWKSKTFSNNTSRMAYFKNSQSRKIYGQILEKDPADGLYKCKIPGNVLTPAGYLFISIVLTTDTKRMLTAEMEKPLSILKAGAHQSTQNNEPTVRSAIEKITQNLSDKDRSTQDMILTKLSEEDYDFGWSDKFEGTSRTIFTEDSEEGHLLGSISRETIKDEDGNIIGVKTEVGNTRLSYFGNTIFGNLWGDVKGNLTGDVKGNTTGFHTGDVKGNVEGNVIGDLTGNVKGNVIGNTTGFHTGDVKGNVEGNVIGNLKGNSEGIHTGDVIGNVTGNTEGIHNGDVIGSVTGNLKGNVTGDTTGFHTGDVKGNVTGDLTGNVKGNVEGNVTGNLIGNTNGLHTGDVKGNTEGLHTGNVKGNVEGNLTGNADTATILQTARTITINSPNFISTSQTFDGSKDISFNLQFDESAKIPAQVLPDFILGQMVYGGTFDAATSIATFTQDGKSKLGITSNSLTLTSQDYSKHEGIYYIVKNPGTFASLSFAIGDWLVSNEAGWDKIDNTDQVISVNGKQGAVTLIASDVGAYTQNETNQQINSHNQAADAHPNGISGNAATATEAEYAKEAGHSINADNAAKAIDADNAIYSVNADNAKEANHAASADNATKAINADNATHADNADNAKEANHATNADLATRAVNADSATNAAHSTKADESIHATNADNATRAANADEAIHASNADNATAAEKLKNPKIINGVSFDGTSNIVNYGVCSTEKTNSNKAVNIPNFTRQIGSLAIIKFEYTDGSSNLTLNISNTGAAPVYSGGVPIGTGRIKAGYSYIFVFDGTNYILISALESCTEESKLITYTELSVPSDKQVLVPATISGYEGWDRAIMVFDQEGNYLILDKDYFAYSNGTEYYLNITSSKVNTSISICFLKTSALEELTLGDILSVLDGDHQFVTQQEKDKWNSIDLDLTIEDIDAVLDTNHRFVSDVDIERWNSIDLDLTLSDIEEVLDEDHQLVSATEKEKWNNSLAEQGTELWIFECGTSSTNIDK